MTAHLLLAVIVALSILLMLVRPRGIAEVYWVGGGALLLAVLGLIPWRLAGRAVLEGSDVYFFLIGMMLLSELAREHGVFEWLSSAAVAGARGSSVRLFTLVYGIGTVVTILMSNDATAVVLTPAILAAVRKAKAEPLPHLFACALIANAASFVLPISNPANLVVFQEGMPTLPRWIAAFGLPSLLSIGVTYLTLRMLFRRQLRAPLAPGEETAPLAGEGRLVLVGLGLMVAVLLTASALGMHLGLPTMLASFAITAVLSLRSRSNPLRLAREISWSTLALVAGLFVLVDAMESVGALRFAVAALHRAQGMPLAGGAYAAGFVLGVADNLLNNLPVGLLAGGAVHAAQVHGLLAHAVLIGVDLGPNLSVTGSLATILWLIALRREGLDVSFGRFLKVGAVAMPAAMLAALGGSLAMQWLLRGR
jgi:arsenical pump membrane protein